MLTEAVNRYLAVRRAVGFTLTAEGRLLNRFAEFADARDQHTISSAIAIEWAGLAQSVLQRARRLGLVIRLARYLRAEDGRHEIPPAVFGADRLSRPTPYILTLAQIRAVIQAAAQSGYRAHRALRRATYSTLFSLLACTGLRVSEAIRLRYDDLTPDGLIIRRTKFGKSRLVPLHQTAQAGLEWYLRQRRPFAAADDHVFVSLNKTALRINDVDKAFRTAVDRAGVPRRPGRQSRATPHSLRHTFATRALQTCPPGRDAITRHMVALSTYLGHSTVADTYWYLEAIPDLMRDIADQTEQVMMGGQP
jgi:integrase/recombinase XerD